VPRKSIPSDVPVVAPAQAVRFRAALLRWFRRHGRNLPWRQTRDAYRIVVSEFMLQQTQVSRVEAYYHRFLERFPDVQTLAVAETTHVREAWQGLGYYRRAANLQKLAQAVVAEHDGRLPDDPTLLVRLPGVGRYTAGAVASFAYERAVPAVDTNVARVIRRAFRPDRPASPNDRVLWDAGHALVPRRATNAWAFNQAIMELGALVCTARVAKCGACPVRRACLIGGAAGRGGELKGVALETAMQSAAAALRRSAPASAQGERSTAAKARTPAATEKTRKPKRRT
jgi:A/G-specific adenine glycosylase